MLAALITKVSFLLSPPFCVACKKFLEVRVPLCEACEQLLTRIVSYDVVVTGQYRMTVFGLSHYSGVIRSLILAKQRGQRVASKQLGQLMAEHCLCDWDTYDYVIPIPLHWTRYASRGFNQAEVIARVLADKHGLCVSQGATRVSRTAYQASLSRDGRKKNVLDVFCISPECQKQYRGKHLLIVDDLMTTGATIQALGRVLAQCKSASITAVVAARVL